MLQSLGRSEIGTGTRILYRRFGNAEPRSHLVHVGSPETQADQNLVHNIQRLTPTHYRKHTQCQSNTLTLSEPPPFTTRQSMKPPFHPAPIYIHAQRHLYYTSITYYYTLYPPTGLASCQQPQTLSAPLPAGAAAAGSATTAKGPPVVSPRSSFNDRRQIGIQTAHPATVSLPHALVLQNGSNQYPISG